MSHPLVEILARIEAEYMAAEGDTHTLFAEYDAKVLAAFEARDLAVAKAVQVECLDVAHYEDSYSLIGDIADDLEEIIKGVK